MTRHIIPAVGPKHARIMLVGEAPGAEEDQSGTPFVGRSGQELDRMLAEAGIVRADCYITNTFKSRPPQNDVSYFVKEKHESGCVSYNGRWLTPTGYADILNLKKEIEEVKPNVVIALGDTAMWALTNKSGITSWRGSILEAMFSGSTIYKIIPTYHPAAVVRMWEWRHIALLDLRRAKVESMYPEIHYPLYKFTVRPDFYTVVSWLERTKLTLNDGMKVSLSVDIETRLGHIACVGIAGSAHSAICIPFMCIERPEGFWSAVEEKAIVALLKEVLTHQNAFIIGQNFLYDAQYFARHWGFVPNIQFDTMIAQHTCFPGLPKALHFLSSMYCTYHQYWKDEGKLWDPKTMPEERLWQYNCRDAVATYEVCTVLNQTIRQMSLDSVWDFQMSLFTPILKMMMRGIRIDHSLREEFAVSLVEEEAKRQQYLNTATGKQLNIRSPKQLANFFYNDMAIQPIKNRDTGNVTTNDDALKRIGQRELLLRPVVDRIAEMRSIGVYYSTFVQGRYDTDQRLRCSFNIAGTTTFRFSSSEDAFGFGMNLQNIPKEDADLKEKLKRGAFILPNVRRLFLPDKGYCVIDYDLDRADLQVVVWEAEDEELRDMLRQGIDLHIENAKVLFNRTSGIDKDSPERQLAKTFVHGTNYGGSARTMAMHCSTSLLSLTVHDADQMQKRWFGAHPGIKKWHTRVSNALNNRREVRNAFGYRRYFFERIDSVLPEALAWIPQSTVACVINRALVNIDNNLSTVNLLIQVHDSLVMQAPIYQLKHTDLLQQINANMKVVVPYRDPLVIPANCKISEANWGEVKKPTKDNELKEYYAKLAA